MTGLPLSFFCSFCVFFYFKLKNQLQVEKGGPGRGRDTIEEAGATMKEEQLIISKNVQPLFCLYCRINVAKCRIGSINVASRITSFVAFLSLLQRLATLVAPLVAPRRAPRVVSTASESLPLFADKSRGPGWCRL